MLLSPLKILSWIVALKDVVFLRLDRSFAASVSLVGRSVCPLTKLAYLMVTLRGTVSFSNCRGLCLSH